MACPRLGVARPIVTVLWLSVIIRDMNTNLPFERQCPDEILPTRAGYDRWAEIYDDEDNALITFE